jgi:membrane protease YdiL (CAAX protease family)
LAAWSTGGAESGILRPLMTTAPPPTPHPPTWPSTNLPRPFWWGSALAAPLLAALVVRLGFGVALDAPWRTLGLLALAAIVEEIVFRGGLLRLLLRRWPTGRKNWQSISAANALTSAVFALAHLWSHPPLAALGVLPVSLLLGWAYERSGQRLAPPIVLHLYFNVVLLAASLALH